MIVTRGSVALLAVALLLALAACGDDGSKKAPPTDPGPSIEPLDAGDARVAPPSPQPPTVEGLTAQLDVLVVAIESGDVMALAEHINALALPSPESWFRDRFSGKRATQLLADYEPIATNIVQLAELLKALRADGLIEMSVAKFEKVDDLEAVGYQTRALKAMRISDPLYSVRLNSADGKKQFHLWSFVHAGDRFRYVGKMQSIGKTEMIGDTDLNEFRPTDADRLRKAGK